MSCLRFSFRMETNEVTKVFCFVFVRDQPMWFTKPITSAGAREDKSSAPGEDFAAARFGWQVFSGGVSARLHVWHPLACVSVARRIWDPWETSAFLVSWELQNVATWETPARGAGAARCSSWQLLPLTNAFRDFVAVIGLLWAHQKPWGVCLLFPSVWLIPNQSLAVKPAQGCPNSTWMF